VEPLILSLDTSTPTLSCALLRPEADGLRVLGAHHSAPGQVVSTLVPGLFDTLLSQTGLAASDVGLVCAGLGPGLFTGVRVAVATMKAIAYARQLPLAGAGSLESMALAAARGGPARPGDVVTAPPESGLLCPVLDARKGEVYFAVYRVQGGLPRIVLAPAAGSPASMAEALRALSESVAVFGTGAPGAAGVLGSLANVRVHAEPMFPGAAEIAALALRRNPAPVFDPARLLSLEPDYLRPPMARRKDEG